MSAPESNTSADEALSSLMGAALGTPNTARPDSISAPAYGSPADVALRIRDYIGRHGRESTATLLLYEAMKALRALAAGDARAVAALAELVACDNLKRQLASVQVCAFVETDEDFEEMDRIMSDLARRQPAAWDAAPGPLAMPALPSQ